MNEFEMPPPPPHSFWGLLKYWLRLWRLATSRIIPPPPPHSSLRRRLKYRLELGRLFTSRIIPAFLRGFLVVAPLLLLFAIILVACLLPLLLLAYSGPLITGFFFWLSRQEALTSPIAEIIYALLYTLLGLAALLAAHRWWARIPRDQLPQQGLGLFFSRAGRTFWTGTALCAIAAAQLLVPAYAHWLNILFWVVTGCVVLLPYLFDLFRFLLRGFRRLAQGHP